MTLIRWQWFGGTQTGSYQTGSYQKGCFIPPKPKLIHIYIYIYICVFFFLFAGRNIPAHSNYRYIFPGPVFHPICKSGSWEQPRLIRPRLYSSDKFHSVFVWPRPWHIEIRHRVKTSPQLICSDLRLSNWKFEDWNYGNRPWSGFVGFVLWLMEHVMTKCRLHNA